MSLRLSPLFDQEGRGTPLLFGQLRRRMPAQPVQSRAILVTSGQATKYFADWWRVAFPGLERLPADAVANRDGTGTDRFWDVLG